MSVKAELLAPAGNMECLIAAVRSGADAVYFGGGAFNARRGAANFVGDELKQAIDFCHLRGVQAHLTLNPQLFDRELEAALQFAAKLRSLRADAVIVQDIGLAALIAKELPGLTIHASTQMGIHSPGGLRYCEEHGIRRAVLARETPLDEIRVMHAASPVELEFFCHGALCMGFSGSCLYSSMAGERSGNRGTCAQPCRKNASVLSARAGSGEFALSTNDICMIDELAALTDAGICSFKIEGRMKSPEYVATVTRIYRAALDGEKPSSARRELFEIFNRGEFSTAHIKGDSVTTGHVGRAKPSAELTAKAHESVRHDRPTRGVSAALDITVAQPARLKTVCGGFEAEAVGPICEAPNKPVDKSRLAEQLGKFGGTPFFMEECAVTGDGYLSVSALNSMRREASERLSALITGEPAEEKRVDADTLEGFIQRPGPAKGEPLSYVRVRSEGEAAKAAGDLIGFDPVFPDRADVSQLEQSGKKLVLILPNVLLTGGARRAYEALAASGAFCGIEINNLGHFDMGRELPIRIAGAGMNIMNSASATQALSMGFTHFMPSLELTRPQLHELSLGFGANMIVNTFGRAQLMQLLHCPVKEYRGCRACRGQCGALSDGEGRSFPLENVRFGEGYCLVRMLNSAVTDVREAFARSGMRVFALAETPDKYPGAPVTRGHWNRAVD